MDWKEFLEPTAGKIILWWALFLFGPGYSYGELYSLLGAAIIGTVFINPQALANYQTGGYALLMLLIYYMVSCILFSSHNKLKSQK